MTTSFEQIVGLVLLAFGGWLLWSAWAFVIAGLLALVVPELVVGRRK